MQYQVVTLILTHSSRFICHCCHEFHRPFICACCPLYPWIPFALTSFSPFLQAGQCTVLDPSFSLLVAPYGFDRSSHRTRQQRAYNARSQSKRFGLTPSSPPSIQTPFRIYILGPLSQLATASGFCLFVAGHQIITGEATPPRQWDRQSAVVVPTPPRTRTIHATRRRKVSPRLQTIAEEIPWPCRDRSLHSESFTRSEDQVGWQPKSSSRAFWLAPQPTRVSHHGRLRDVQL